MGGWTPDKTLHNSMIQTCKLELSDFALIDKETRRLCRKNGKPQLQPDLLLGNIAVECHTLNPRELEKLEGYGIQHEYSILCVSIPSNVAEIWTYDVGFKTISSKNIIGTNQSIQITFPLPKPPPVIPCRNHIRGYNG